MPKAKLICHNFGECVISVTNTQICDFFFRVPHQLSELSRLTLCDKATSGLENGHSSAGSERFLLCWPVLLGDSSSKRPTHTHTHSLALHPCQVGNN